MRWLTAAAMLTCTAVFIGLIAAAIGVGQKSSTWIVSYQMVSPATSASLWVYDEARRLHVRLLTVEPAIGLEASPDRSAVLSLATTETIELIDLRSDRTYRLAGSNPQWSPDGQSFTYGVSDQWQVIRRTWNGWRQIATFRLGRDGYPVGWSPDGTRLLFEIDADEGSVFFLPDIYVGSLDGRDLVNISRASESTDQLPAWSPDGRWIAFVSTRDEDSELYVSDPRGRTLRRLTFDSANDLLSQWSPDSRRIAFYSDRSGSPGLYVLALDKPDDVMTVATGITAFGSVVWSPESRQILYQNGGHLWLADLETRRTQQLPNRGGTPILLP